VLALLGAGVAGGVVSNPGVAVDLLRMAATFDRGEVTALDLVPPDDATHTAATDGRWGEPSTWDGGEVPGDGARVLIPEGRAVTLASESGARLEWVLVRGSLSFDPTTDKARAPAPAPAARRRNVRRDSSDSFRRWSAIASTVAATRSGSGFDIAARATTVRRKVICGKIVVRSS
jgi:hypothetical protein